MSKFAYRLNGKKVTREEFDKLAKSKEGWLEQSPMVSNTYTEHDPLISEGCGVMKSQVNETRDLIKRHCIQGAAVHNNGQMRFTSRRARKEFLALRGLNDQDAGFGD